MNKKDFKPMVSIIIPVYNGENYLERAIKSAINQTYSNKEIIVVNDGSTDNTDSIIERYKSKIVYIKKENGGVATALNEALKIMRGKYFSWLSHDDLYLEDKIEKQIEFLSNQSDKDLVLYTDYNIINEDDKIVAVAQKNHEELEKKPEYSLLRGNINGITMLIPKKCFEECGLFNPKLRCIQDYDLWRKFQKKFKFVHVPIITASTRIHSMQDSQISPNAVKEGNELWIEMMDDLDDNRKIELEGSVYNYYNEMELFLKNTPYKKAQDYANNIKNIIRNNALINRKDNLVSVIIPFYNRIDLLERAINSVLKSTFLNYEIIIIDDASTDDIDGLLDFIKDKKNIKYYRNKSNRGPSYSRNIGLKKCSGDYIAFLDSDDEFMPNKILIQLSEMIINNSNASYTNYYAIDGEGINEVNSFTIFNNEHNEFIDNCKLATPTIMLKRDFIVNNNIKYNENIKVCEDTCFYLEVLKKTDFLYVDKYLTKVNISTNSHINDSEKRKQGLKNLINYVLNDNIYCNYYFELYYLIAGYAKFFDNKFNIFSSENEDVLNEEIEKYKNENDNLAREINNLHKIITKIYNSKSMKITKPFRVIRKFFRFGGKND